MHPLDERPGLKPSWVAGEDGQRGTVSLEKHFLKMLSMKLADDPVILLLGIYSRKNESMYLPQILYVNVHSNVVHNSQKMGLMQTPVSW